ncbi:MAG: hypothetical protein ACPGQV_00650 [Alphaproteobacteria bacterium]
MKYAEAIGLPALFVLGMIQSVDGISVLGKGKIDYDGVQELYDE